MKKFSWKSAFKRTSAVLMIGLLMFGGWYGWGMYRNLSKITGNNNPLQLVGAFTPADLEQTNGRTNILLAGYSNDDAGHSGADLTDSIMIISIDQSDKSAVVLSVPRDLYVNIDGYGYSKINAAYVYGEQDDFAETGYADGGMGLLEKTVEDSLGIHSNYEALINYTAFKDLVDAVGGVTIDIQSSNANGLYDPNTNLKLANGEVKLDGQTALNLARSRGEGYGSYGFTQGDFTRTQNQQAILLALKTAVGSSLSLTKVADISSALGNNVKTDLQLNEIKTLYSVLKNYDTTSIKTITLNDINGENLLASYTTSGGQSTLIPAAGITDFSDIQSVLDAMLHPKTTASTTQN
jgi:LCP family protein required for cell wall assembly